MFSFKPIAAVFIIFCISLVFSGHALAKRGEKDEELLKQSVYIGSKACGECHKNAYENFTKYSKKANSGKALQRMSASVPAEDMGYCPTCHTTGYKKGGFVDFQSTPQFADVGCETCHGPGSIHAATKNIKAIDVPSIETCESCHTEKVKVINYKPLRFSAAH